MNLTSRLPALSEVLGGADPGKATAIDPSVVENGVYRHRGPARVFTSEAAAIAAIKGLTEPKVAPGDVLVLAGLGPSARAWKRPTR